MHSCSSRLVAVLLLAFLIVPAQQEKLDVPLMPDGVEMDSDIFLQLGPARIHGQRMQIQSSPGSGLPSLPIVPFDGDMISSHFGQCISSPGVFTGGGSQISQCIRSLCLGTDFHKSGFGGATSPLRELLHTASKEIIRQ